jgi:hypothetical protein
MRAPQRTVASTASVDARQLRRVARDEVLVRIAVARRARTRRDLDAVRRRGAAPPRERLGEARVRTAQSVLTLRPPAAR